MSNPKRFNTFSHLDRLLADFERLKNAARDLRTPNTEDEFIRCGIVGFSQHLPADRWDFEHFGYVRGLRDEVADGNYSDDWVRFTCLAAGYFRAMVEAKLITDVELQLSEFHTPGFMWLKCEAFGGAPGLEAG